MLGISFNISSFIIFFDSCIYLFAIDTHSGQIYPSTPVNSKEVFSIGLPQNEQYVFSFLSTVIFIYEFSV